MNFFITSQDNVKIRKTDELAKDYLLKLTLTDKEGVLCRIPHSPRDLASLRSPHPCPPAAGFAKLTKKDAFKRGLTRLFC